MPDVDYGWFSPEGSIGLLLLFFATLGGFVIALYRLLRRPSQSYIEVHKDDWKLFYHGPTQKLTVTGLVTIATPAASIDATCETRLGKKKVELPMKSANPHLRYQATVLNFEAIEAVDIDPQISELPARITVKLSDGKRKSDKVTIRDFSIRPPKQHTDEDAQETPEPSPEGS